MYDGWILDVYPNYELDTISVWLWTHSGARVVTDRYSPRFYVHGSASKLRECMRWLKDDEGVESAALVPHRLSLDSDKLHTVLEVAVRSYRKFKELPVQVNRWGRYTELQLYDVDLRLAQKYMYAKGIFPMAHVKVGRTFRMHDEVFSMDYEVPPLRTVELSVTAGSAGSSKRASYDDPLTEVALKNDEGDRINLESSGGEPELMLELAKTVDSIDPDIIYTRGGDEVIFPYLYYRSGLHGLGSRFVLDRDRTLVSAVHRPSAAKNSTKADADTQPHHEHRPEHGGKSFFSYGRIYYKPPFYSLKGRLHIDQKVSFMHRESGFLGLVEIARLAGIPLQTMSRLSPGSAISAIQVGQAMRDGVLIKWKKNKPELFKSAADLLVADRGGHIFDPYMGIHDNVFEVDFTSLYPSIIARRNISPETVLCKCCSDTPGVQRIPGLEYHICARQRGLIPKVVAPLVMRRIAYKRRGGEANDARQKVLKWVLVTCFGYTGYRNARFGRIECHEAITAFAREVMLDAMEIAESQGYEVLHGYVDSLWLKPASEYYAEPGRYNMPDESEPVESVCRKIARRIGVPLEFEGRYRWIVFLPNKSSEVGALTRYYGMFDDGTLRVRGIELRQHSTPPLFMQFQTDILEKFKEGSSVSDLYELLPQVLALFTDYADRILAGRCDAKDLVFNARVTRTVEEYRVFNNQLAALKQLDDEGVEVHPGEHVSYLILNSRTHDPYKRVKLGDRVEGGESYDRRKYVEYLCRTGDSILRPFGYDEEVLGEYLKKTRQTALDKYTTS
jgi:DNA polymerase elongation subunit (family B)